MLYTEIIAVCSEIHTKHINTLCGQNVELLNVKLAVRIVTTGPNRVMEHFGRRAVASISADRPKNDSNGIQTCNKDSSTPWPTAIGMQMKSIWHISRRTVWFVCRNAWSSRSGKSCAMWRRVFWSLSPRICEDPWRSLLQFKEISERHD